VSDGSVNRDWHALSIVVGGIACVDSGSWLIRVGVVVMDVSIPGC
jgi:hypothetical protein